MSELGSGREFDLVREFLERRKRTEHPEVMVGPGDDCAIVGGFAISTDCSVENVHFRREWLTGAEIGYRAAAAALSDLAAMAAEPVAALVSFAFSAADANGWAQEVMAGATAVIEEYGAMLVGGDVTRTEGGAVIDVVVIGRCVDPVLRSRAQPGDEIWVTGNLGGAAAAVAAWQTKQLPAHAARARFAHPEPRVHEAMWLHRRAGIHAMLDLSDGIAGDARHIAAASACRLSIDAALLPCHPDATVEQGLRGGEDYELCLAAAPGLIASIADEFQAHFGVSLTHVGVVTTGDGVEIINGPAGSGFDHFSEQ